MKQMIALWFMVKVHGLMVADPGSVPLYAIDATREADDSRRASWGLGAM
jgi:hypothetical protein